MATDKNTRERILNLAGEQFFNHGFSKVTTDELAVELGMSKKTIYKYFPSKERLLEEVVDASLARLKTGAEEIIYDPDMEFVRKLETLLSFVSRQVAILLKRPFLNDLQKNAPEIWQKIEAFRKEMIHTRFARLIREGMDEDVFRTDVDQEIVVMTLFSAIHGIINPETLSNLPVTADEAFKSITKILFEGLLTEKARKKL